MKKAVMTFLLILLAFAAFARKTKGTVKDVPADVLGVLQSAFGALTSSQRDAVAHIMDAWRQYGDGDRRKLAYILATAKHESGFKPIKEYRASAGTSLRAIQDKYWSTGFFGRGFVQLTHLSNYQKMSKFLGVDLVAKPDLALNPIYAAKILVYGMMNGTFTGKALEDYIKPQSADFINARRVVNGTDKADKIAGYANKINDGFTS